MYKHTQFVSSFFIGIETWNCRTENMRAINHLNILRDVNIFQDFIVNRAHSNAHDFPMMIAQRLNKLGRNGD